MQAFQWTSEVEVAFQTLKETFCTAPIIAYPQPREMFVVDTDTSNARIGGVLSQRQDGQERVTAYYSKTLNKAEKNYWVTQRELLSVMRILKLYGQEPHLRSDHCALTWLICLKNLKVQTAGWLQHLQEYNFREPPRTKTITPTFFRDIAKRIVPTATKSTRGQNQTGTSYCDYCRSRLGSSRSENRTERPGHRAHSGGSRDWTALRTEIYH
jgi:hypothetical protein